MQANNSLKQISFSLLSLSLSLSLSHTHTHTHTSVVLFLWRTLTNTQGEFGILYFSKMVSLIYIYDTWIYSSLHAFLIM